MLPLREKEFNMGAGLPEWTAFKPTTSACHLSAGVERNRITGALKWTCEEMGQRSTVTPFPDLHLLNGAEKHTWDVNSCCRLMEPSFRVSLTIKSSKACFFFFFFLFTKTCLSFCCYHPRDKKLKVSHTDGFSGLLWYLTAVGDLTLLDKLAAKKFDWW